MTQMSLSPIARGFVQVAVTEVYTQLVEYLTAYKYIYTHGEDYIQTRVTGGGYPYSVVCICVLSL
jgi:hypothetical protein